MPKVKHRLPALRALAANQLQVIGHHFTGVRYIVTINIHGQILQAKRGKETLKYNQLPFGFVDHFYFVNPEHQAGRTMARPRA